MAAPILTFKDVAKAIDFYAIALGARQTVRFEVGDKVAHAEIMIEDSKIVLAEEWPDGGRFSAETLGQSPINIALEVEDVDVFAERVCGGIVIFSPAATARSANTSTSSTSRAILIGDCPSVSSAASGLHRAIPRPIQSLNLRS